MLFRSLVFLNKAGFNGLYRVNRQGDFNVPSGHKHTISLFDWDNIMEMSEQLKRTNIYYGDFRVPCEYAQCGDFVMFDPPYHETFTNYQAAGFTNVDQQRLFDFYKELSCRGVYCLQTNSDSEFIRTLYHNYNIIPVNVNHSINADGNNRKAKEIIITNYKSDCEAFVA